MPRPVSQYFSLPFNWHSIRSTSSLSSGALPDAGVLYRRPVKADTGGSSLPPGTAPEPAAQGVYVNTPRIKRNPSAPPGGLCPIRTRISAALCREAGRLVSRHPAGEESGSGKPPGRKPHMCFAALPQRLQRPRCAPAAARSSVQRSQSAQVFSDSPSQRRPAQARRLRARRLGVMRRR